MSYTPKAVREENKAKILSVLKALNKPITSVELGADPLLAMDGRAVAAYLRVLQKEKLVKKTSKKWSAISNSHAEAPQAQFIIMGGQVLLDVGGLRLPVRVE